MISWKTAAVAALTWAAASVTFAQQVTHVAKTNPFGLFASQYQLGYEHGLNDNFSVQLSAGFMGGTGEASDLNDPHRLVYLCLQKLSLNFDYNMNRKIYMKYYLDLNFLKVH